MAAVDSYGTPSFTRHVQLSRSRWHVGRGGCRSATAPGRPRPSSLVPRRAVAAVEVAGALRFTPARLGPGGAPPAVQVLSGRCRRVVSAPGSGRQLPRRQDLQHGWGLELPAVGTSGPLAEDAEVDQPRDRLVHRLEGASQAIGRPRDVDEGIGDQRFSQVSDETGRPDVAESRGVRLLYAQKAVNADGGVEG